MNAEALFFKALSEPTRLRLVALLAVRGETCVCYLAGALDEPDFKISRHLGILRSAGVVEARRAGTWMHYRLAGRRSPLERSVLEALRRHAKASPASRADLKRLSAAACKVG